MPFHQPGKGQVPAQVGMSDVLLFLPLIIDKKRPLKIQESF